jgi:hypothetical protein
LLQIATAREGSHPLLTSATSSETKPPAAVSPEKLAKLAGRGDAPRFALQSLRDVAGCSQIGSVSNAAAIMA